MQFLPARNHYFCPSTTPDNKIHAPTFIICLTMKTLSSYTKSLWKHDQNCTEDAALSYLCSKENHHPYKLFSDYQNGSLVLIMSFSNIFVLNELIMPHLLKCCCHVLFDKWVIMIQ